MKFFLDSAILDEIIYARQNWAIDGVTTNPRHIQVSGKPFQIVLREIADLVADDPDFPVSVEINPHLNQKDEMVAAARRLAALSPNFVIKLPCTEPGVSAGWQLEQEGIRTNITLVFSPGQAIQAGRIGARFVSPFVAWKEEAGEDCVGYINDVVRIYQNYAFKTEIIVAALRNSRQMAYAAIAGAQIITAGFDVIKASFENPYTAKGVDLFCSFWDKTDTSGIQ
jgi:transaldolase